MIGRGVFITGATGYLGAAAADALDAAGYEVRRGTRRPIVAGTAGGWYGHGALEQADGWSRAFRGIDVVVHFAGRAHVPDTAAGALEARRINAEGTAVIARAAVEAGVRRFVLISSALVCGTASPSGRPFTEEDVPHPATAYARSKREAEQHLVEIANGGGMEWVAVRPPMVYGPGSPGNFHRLARMVARGLPLPLGLATAPKSFVSVANLVSAVLCVVEHPAVARHTVLVADDETTSTAGLVRLMALAMGRPARLLPVPESLLRATARIAGRQGEIARLLDPLHFSTDKLRDLTGWRPPLTLAQGVGAALSSRVDGRPVS